MLMLGSMQLSTDQVHLWTASLEVSDRVGDTLWQTLSLDERERAARFRIDRDRHCFIAGRGILRCILAEYVGSAASEIQFHYRPQGKPYLAAANSSPNLEFNLAHSNGLVMVAISRGHRVGVDIEYLQPLSDLESMARAVFTGAEQMDLAKLPVEQRLVGWYNGWTRKEAYLKGRGDGLLMSPKAIDVSLAPGAPVALLSNRLDPHDVAHWSLFAVSRMGWYVGALAVEGDRIQVHHGQWVP